MFSCIEGPFIFNTGFMGKVECVRNIFRQIYMGTKNGQNYLYGYEIIFYKFGQKILDCTQFLDFISPSKKSLEKT